MRHEGITDPNFTTNRFWELPLSNGLHLAGRLQSPVRWPGHLCEVCCRQDYRISPVVIQGEV